MVGRKPWKDLNQSDKNLQKYFQGGYSDIMQICVLQAEEGFVKVAILLMTMFHQSPSFVVLKALPSLEDIASLKGCCSWCQKLSCFCLESGFFVGITDRSLIRSISLFL